MIVECPECNTKFNIEARLVGLDERVVRCGKCHFQWSIKASKEDIAREQEATESTESTESGRTGFSSGAAGTVSGHASGRATHVW